MVFDTWGGVLTPRDYRDFSLQYMHKIVDGLIREHEGRRAGHPVHQNGGQWLEQIAATGCDALGLDWTTDIADAKRRVGDKVALQGNMDPPCSTPPLAGSKEVATILAGFGHGNGQLQPGARHPSGCGPGTRRRVRQRGARAVGPVPRR